MLFQKYQICFLTMPNSNSVEENNHPKTEFLTQTFQDSRHGFADFSWVVQVGGGWLIQIISTRAADTLSMFKK